MTTKFLDKDSLIESVREKLLGSISEDVFHVKHSGHPDAEVNDAYKHLKMGKTYTNHMTKYETSAKGRADMLKKKGFKDVQVFKNGKLMEDTLDEQRFEKGEDVGEPGLNFKKIAKKAAKEYGSKEAGQRVAGAILKKVLHKEETEELDETLMYQQKHVGWNVYSTSKTPKEHLGTVKSFEPHDEAGALAHANKIQGHAVPVDQRGHTIRRGSLAKIRREMEQGISHGQDFYDKKLKAKQNSVLKAHGFKVRVKESLSYKDHPRGKGMVLQAHDDKMIELMDKGYKPHSLGPSTAPGVESNIMKHKDTGDKIHVKTWRKSNLGVGQSVEPIKEDVDLVEGKFAELHADIGEHMDKHIGEYRRAGGAEALMAHAAKAAHKIAKLHGMDHATAEKHVSSYIDSKLNEDVFTNGVDLHEVSLSPQAEFKHPSGGSIKLSKQLHTGDQDVWHVHHDTFVPSAGRHGGRWASKTLHKGTEADMRKKFNDLKGVNESLAEAFEAGKTYKVGKDDGDFKKGSTIHIHTVKDLGDKGPRKGLHYKVTHKQAGYDDYHDTMSHNELSGLKLHEETLDESTVYDGSPKTHRETEDTMTQVHKIMKGKGYNKKSWNQSAMTHHTYTKGGHEVNISMWHGNGKYGNHKALLTLSDSAKPRSDFKPNDEWNMKSDADHSRFAKSVLSHVKGLKEETLSEEIKIGDSVHVGLIKKGGTGFEGVVTHMDQANDKITLRSHHKEKFGYQTYRGRLSNATHK